MCRLVDDPGASKMCYCGQPAVAMHTGPDPHKAKDKPRPVCDGCARTALIDQGYGLLSELTCLYPVRKAGEDPKVCGLEWPCPEHAAEVAGQPAEPAMPQKTVDSRTGARRGDLLLVARQHREVGQGGTSAEWTTWQFGEVVSATRDGRVKTWREAGYPAALRPVRGERFEFVPAGELAEAGYSVAEALATAEAHHYQDHPGQPEPFLAREKAAAWVLDDLSSSLRAAEVVL